MDLDPRHPLPFEALPSGSPMLRFQLTSTLWAALSVDCITEVLVIPYQRVLPIPHMDPWVMGAYNWRGQILWLVDLSQRLGQGSLLSGHQIVHTVMVISLPQTLGIAVTAVQDMAWVEADQIDPPHHQTGIPPLLQPYIQGSLTRPHQSITWILDPVALVQGLGGSS